MKPLHLIANNKSYRQDLNFIKIANNTVTVTDGYRAVILPVSQVFPDVFTDTEEFYILGEEFKTAKCHTASRFTREGNKIFAYNNKQQLTGVCNLKTKEECGDNYPDILSVIPSGDPVPVSSIYFNPQFAKDIVDCIGYKPIYEFYGESKPIRIRDQENTEAIAILCPIYH